MLLVTLLAGLILAVADLLIVTVNVVLLLLAGVLLGVFLNSISSWIEQRSPLSYRWSYTLVILMLAATAGGWFFYMGSHAASRGAELWQELQSSSDQLKSRLDQYPWLQDYLSATDSIRSAMAKAGGIAQKAISAVGWLGTGLMVTLFVGLYLAYEPDLYRTGLLKLLPMDKRQRGDEVLQKLAEALRKWIVGRLLSMAVIGICTAVALSLFGVPFAISLGVLAALLTFLPNLGPIIAAVPQVLLALNVGTDTALYVVVFNVVLQGVESYLLTPIVQRYEVTLPPVLIIFAQLLMAVLVGPIGIIMAAPLTVATMVLVQLLYIRDHLGDQAAGELTSGH